MWWGGGHPYSHSTFTVVSSTSWTSRLVANASQRIYRNKMTATSEIREPIDETVFHNA